MGCSSSYKIATASGTTPQQWQWIAPRPSEKSNDRSAYSGVNKDWFTFQAYIGRGMLGEVFVAKSQKDNKYYAIKRITNRSIVDKNRVLGIQCEVSISLLVRNPFVVHMFTAFQDESYLYMVLEYAAGGDLYQRMALINKFPEAVCKFYAAEVAAALHYLHDSKILYRDLKAENVTLGSDGHVLLVDFGLSRRMQEDSDGRLVAKSFSGTGGTTMYMAPEVARMHIARSRPKRKSVGGGGGGGGGSAEPPKLYCGVDWWALGCLIFEMLIGSPPFGDAHDASKEEILEKIIATKEVRLPSELSAPVRDLLRGLLCPDPLKRFGWKEVRNSEWMRGLDWFAVQRKQLIPPWAPRLGPPGSHASFKVADEPTQERQVAESPLSSAELQYCNIKCTGD